MEYKESMLTTLMQPYILVVMNASNRLVLSYDREWRRKSEREGRFWKKDEKDEEVETRNKEGREA